MVDEDRLNDLIGGGDDKKQSSSSKTKSKSKPKKKTVKKKEKTKKQKLEEFKGTSSKSKSSGSTEDVKRLLFTLGNMDAYTRMISNYNFEGIGRAERNVKDDICSKLVGELVNFMGVFNVQHITDKYGYSWDNILRIIKENKDMTGRTMNTNSGSVDEGDIKDLLMCIANILLFNEGIYREKEQIDEDNRSRRDEITLVITEAMNDSYTELISQTEVQKISEKYGFDFEKDILKEVVFDQDFEEMIEG